MIESIVICKLFEMFDYKISFLNKPITIITGPNGYGKSTILRILDALSNGDLLIFLKLSFEKIIINCVDDNKNPTQVTLANKKISCGKDTFDLLELTKFEVNNRLYPFLEEIEEGVYFDRRRGRIIRDIDFPARFLESYDTVPIEHMKSEQAEIYKNIILSLKKNIGEVYFIKEQRLVKNEKKSRTRNESEIIYVIDELPHEFTKMINEISNKYSQISNQLDSTYPNRLFNSNETLMESKEYEIRVEKMTQKFQKLSKYDISDIQRVTSVGFKPEHAVALRIYFDDFDNKYSVYEDFLNKLDLFTDIINGRLTFKQVSISRDKGLSITSNGKELSLDQLSSGEKQEIVLLFELIFKSKQNMLLLIDEPEISLHISWQKKFIDDLQKIVEYNKMNVIVATHSPQIINNHWDWQIDLGSLYAEQLNNR